MRLVYWVFRVGWMALMNHGYTWAARVRFILLGANVASGLDVFGWLKLLIHPRGTLTIGKQVRLNSGYDRNFVGGFQPLAIHVGKNAELRIGDRVGISNSTIICLDRILIEDGVYIGGGCQIYDTDFHALKPESRRDYAAGVVSTAAIRLGKNSFIGGHSIILKGIEIGEAAVIGAGSVVTKNIPANEIWGGNPARFIRSIT